MVGKHGLILLNVLALKQGLETMEEEIEMALAQPGTMIKLRYV
jgi:hypothetical protein